MKIALTGFFADPSGYGELGRRFCKALKTTSAEITPGCLLHDGGMPQQNYVSLGDFLSTQPADNPEAHLMMMWANDFPNFKLPAQRTYGMTCWESRPLPRAYVGAAGVVDKLFLPSEFDAKLWEEEQLPTPLFKITPPVERSVAPESHQNGYPGIKDSTYVFYSILTWQERKNPLGLLTSYLTAFNGFQDVILILKVHGRAAVRRKVELEIAKLQTALNLPYPPEYLLLTESWNEFNMWHLHQRGDCYVNLARGESLSLPVLDALSVGNRIIATGWGGHMDFLKGQPSVYPVSFRFTPVVQPYLHFDGTQVWADPDLIHARSHMISMFNGGRISKVDRDLSYLSPARVGQRLLEAMSD